MSSDASIRLAATCNLARDLCIQLDRIAVALEKLGPPPKNQKRIRVELEGVYDGTPRTVKFRCTGEVYAAAKGLSEIAGHLGLFLEDGRKIVNGQDEILSERIEVPLVVLYDYRNRKPGDMPESPRGGRAQYIVTVDLQPDPATWGWRDWVLL